MKVIDKYLIYSIALLILTGALLRWGKYVMTPQEVQTYTLILIPEVLLVLIFATIKLFKG